jgi:hypothetical protein
MCIVLSILYFAATQTDRSNQIMYCWYYYDTLGDERVVSSVLPIVAGEMCFNIANVNHGQECRTYNAQCTTGKCIVR